MGAIVSGIKDILGFSKDVIAEKDREQNRARAKAAARLKNPIPPPEFYKTIQARDKAEAEGRLQAPYTTAAIRQALKAGILPVGYSEEQLELVGFGPEVKEYAKQILKNGVILRHDLGRLISALLTEVNALPDKGRSSGATQELIANALDVAEKAKAASVDKPEDLIGSEQLQEVINQIRTISEGAAAAADARAALEKLNDQVAQAGADRTAAVVELARKAYAPKSIALRSAPQ